MSVLCLAPVHSGDPGGAYYYAHSTSTLGFGCHLSGLLSILGREGFREDQLVSTHSMGFRCYTIVTFPGHGLSFLDWAGTVPTFPHQNLYIPFS